MFSSAMCYFIMNAKEYDWIWLWNQTHCVTTHNFEQRFIVTSLLLQVRRLLNGLFWRLQGISGVWCQSIDSKFLIISHWNGSQPITTVVLCTFLQLTLVIRVRTTCRWLGLFPLYALISNVKNEQRVSQLFHLTIKFTIIILQIKICKIMLWIRV